MIRMIKERKDIAPQRGQKGQKGHNGAKRAIAGFGENLMSQTAQASLFPAKQTSTQKLWKLPSGWEWVPLDQGLAEMRSGFACARKHSDPDGVPHLRPFNVSINGEVDLSRVIRIPSDLCRDLVDYSLRAGDVLFNNTNSVELVGKTAIVREPLECAFSNHITRLRVCAPSQLDPRWFALALRLLQSQGYFSRLCNKWIGQAGFNPTRLAEVPIPLPSLDTQRCIMSRIESLLAEVKEARTLAAAIRRDTDRVMEAALEEVFGRIREGFEVTGIPQSQIKPIEEVAQLERGKFTHRPRNDRRFFGGTIPWVQIQNVPRDHCKYITEHMDALNEDGLAISKLFPKGTLVVSIAATIGAVGILGFDACFPDSLVGITPDASQVEPGFLYWQLCYLRVHLDAVAPAAAQKNVNLQILGRINLWVPPIPEQKAIDAHLDAIQEEVGEMRHLQAQDAELLDQLEQSILERAFRGKL